MARSGNYQITGNELQAMVNENLIGKKGSIPLTNRCLTRAEVLSGVYCYVGPQELPVSSIPFSEWPIGGGLVQVGASPYLTCNYNYITALPSTSLLFEMSQEGNPYLNVDLFAQANGSPLRLDPGNGLDGMFFGNPQYSPQMSSVVKVGMPISIQANFGLDYAESPGNYGWNAPGYGFLEVYANGSLISDQSLYKTTAYGPNAQQLTYSFNIQSGVSYYVKAWSLVTYIYNLCVDTSTTSLTVCSSCQSNNL
jgi:hypothetical protein